MWSECAAGGFVFCVCVGIVWLCVEGIKCGVSVRQVALGCVCVCVGIVWLCVEGIKCGVSVWQLAFCCVCVGIVWL